MKKSLLLILSSLALCSCGTSTYVSHHDKNDEQLNVGYGTVSKDDNTFSVSKVDIDQKELSTYTDIFDYLRGRVPGVVIGPSSPGTMPDVQVRGAASINSSTQPLFLVDGVATENITYLSPNDVGSVDVLKDASASIYGVRGANGVIMITTKGYLESQRREAEAKKAEREQTKAAKAAKRAAR